MPPTVPWLAGMPEYRLSFAERHVPGVPLGCRAQALRVLASCTDETVFRRQLDDEYLSVIEALLDAGMGFRILNLSIADSPLAEQLRTRGFPEFRIEIEPQGSTYTYPRDLLVYLAQQRLALVHEGWLRAGVECWNETECWPTIWAEGGRMLVSGSTLVVFRHPGKLRAPDAQVLDRLRERGLSIVEIPAGIFCSLDADGDLTGLFHDHHIDRAAGLVSGQDGIHHLLLGPGYRTGTLNEPLDVEASRDAVRRICEPVGIQVHMLPDTLPCYAASVVQSGTVVLAPGAEYGLQELLVDIVGSGNVVTTALTLTHFPVFAAAGLHCLVTESPEFLLAPRSA